MTMLMSEATMESADDFLASPSALSMPRMMPFIIRKKLQMR